MRARWVTWCLAAVLGLGALAAAPPAAVAAAQPAAAQTVPDGFEPVSEVPPEEQLPAIPLVAGAYAFIWVAVLVYVGLLWRRLGVVQKDIDALKRSHSR